MLVELHCFTAPDSGQYNLWSHSQLKTNHPILSLSLILTASALDSPASLFEGIQHPTLRDHSEINCTVSIELRCNLSAQ